MASRFELNNQLISLQNNFFTISRMTRINHQGCTYNHQLQPSKWQHKARTLPPKNPTDAQRDDAQRDIKLNELDRRDRAIRLQLPLNKWYITLTLREQAAKAKLEV